MTPYWETHEAWRERVIAEMWCSFPWKQKYDLFDPDREYNKLNYWTSWLEGAALHWGSRVISRLFNSKGKLNGLKRNEDNMAFFGQSINCP